MVLSDERTVPLKPGVAFWMRPGRTYIASQNPRDRLAVTFVHFEMKVDIDRVPEVYHTQQVEFFDRVLWRVETLFSRGERELAGAWFATALEDLTQPRSTTEQLTGTAQHHALSVRKAAATLRDDLLDPPSLPELARSVGYSPSHFSRLFKRVIGQSPSAYLIQQRVERARQMLSESSLTIGQIADALGYRDIYFFSRQFKSMTGQSPSAYRRGVSG